VKIEKERDCIRVTFQSDKTPEELMNFYDALSNRIDGIYFPSDIRNGKDGILINIRNRESLQSYMEKNIFRMEQFVALLKSLKQLVLSLAEADYDMRNCVWDVDTVFVGSGPEDIEALYLPELPAEKSGGNRLTDLLAVTSLHVFDSRDEAIDAMSDVIRSFDRWEKGEGDYLLTGDVFESGILLLESYCGSGSKLKKEFDLLKLSVKGLFRSSAKPAEEKQPDQVKHDKERNRKVNNKVITKDPVKVSADGDYVSAANKTETGRTAFGGLPDVFKLCDEKAGNPAKNFLNKTKKSPNRNRVGKAKKADIKTRIISLEKLLTDSKEIRHEVQKIEKALPEPTVIGRGDLDNGSVSGSFSTVSRKQLNIYRCGKMFIICDPGSTNGTYLNGQRLETGKAYKLKKGDVIGLSHPHLAVRFG